MKDIDEYSEFELERQLQARRISRDAGLCDYCFRRIDAEPVCKFPDRHRGDVSVGYLFLVDISRVGRARCKRWHPGYPKDAHWNGADWSNAMVGEVGELAEAVGLLYMNAVTAAAGKTANTVKKIRRHEESYANAGDPTWERLIRALWDEVADVYLYLDLLAGYYDVDVDAAVRWKFNEKSKEQGFPERLPDRAFEDERDLP